VGAWDDDNTDIMVGKRRMRTKRHASRSKGPRILLALFALLLVAAGGVMVWWAHRPTGLAALPNPAIIAPGGFRTSISDDSKTITVGLEIRNTAGVDVQVASVRVIPPPGLTETALAVAPSGVDNSGFTLTGDLPKTTSVKLGTGDDKSAVILARFTVNCKQVVADPGAAEERIFVTIQAGTEQREEEMINPVVTSVDSDLATSWLTDAAHHACNTPIPTGTPGTPEPPLGPDTASPNPNG
jgi:hypothetical protein